MEEIISIIHKLFQKTEKKGTLSKLFFKDRITLIRKLEKITADGDCSHEIKRRLLLGRKVTTNLDSILKSRYIILTTKIHLVKAMVFPVVMDGC